MYIYQANTGYWYVAPYTSTAFHMSQFHSSIDRGFDTQKEAEAALRKWRAEGGIEKRKY